MEWLGEQGPLIDSIAGATDSSGWIVQGRRPALYCCHCTEEMSEIENIGLVCWACDNVVPADWEQMHDDALLMTEGVSWTG